MTLFKNEFYTDDFDQEMLDFITSKEWGLTSEYSKSPILTDGYLVYGTGVNRFWTSSLGNEWNGGFDYMTKSQFKEKIGMTKEKKAGYKLADGSYSSEYKVGDKFVVINSNKNLDLHKSQIVTLSDDDGSSCPYFNNAELCIYWHEIKSLDKATSPAELYVTFPELEAGKHIVTFGEKTGLYLAHDIIVWVQYGDDKYYGWDRLSEVMYGIDKVYVIQEDTMPTTKSATLIWDKNHNKQQNIRKELEFAKAKRERLNKHIVVLEGKLK